VPVLVCHDGVFVECDLSRPRAALGGWRNGVKGDAWDPSGNLRRQHIQIPGWISLAAAHRNKLINFDQQVDRHVSCKELPKQDTIQMAFVAKNYFGKQDRCEVQSHTTGYKRKKLKRS